MDDLISRRKAFEYFVALWECSGNVWQDTCVVDEGIGLEENGDWLDIVAWMPFVRPEPWKGEDDGQN